MRSLFWLNVDIVFVLVSLCYDTAEARAEVRTLFMVEVNYLYVAGTITLKVVPA